MFNCPTRAGFSLLPRVFTRQEYIMAFAPIDAKYVVTELNPVLTEELLHSGLAGADLHAPKAHTHVAGANGEVQFNEAGAFQADSNFFWDNVNKRLGIGTATPACGLHVGDGSVAPAAANGAEDVYIERRLEVNSSCYLGNNASISTTAADFVLGPTIAMRFRSAQAPAGTLYGFWTARINTNLSLHVYKTTAYHNFVLGSSAHWNKDYDLPQSPDPTFWIFSETDPEIDGTEWINFTHNQTDGVIKTGKGNLKLSPFGDVEVTTDQIFTGDGSGLPFGAFYGNNIAWTSVAFGGGGTFVIISDSDIVGGEVNATTFQNEQELLIATAGRYLINWAVSGECAGANKHLELAPGINGTANIAGRNHFETGNANQEYTCSGTCILDLAATNTLSLMVTNVDDNTQVEIHHINLTAVHIGGT